MNIINHLIQFENYNPFFEVDDLSLSELVAFLHETEHTNILIICKDKISENEKLLVFHDGTLYNTHNECFMTCPEIDYHWEVSIDTDSMSSTYQVIGYWTGEVD